MTVELKKFFTDFIVIENFKLNGKERRASIFQKEIMHFNFKNETCINKLYQYMKNINKIYLYLIKLENKLYRRNKSPSERRKNKINFLHKKIIKICIKIKKIKIKPESKFFTLPTDRLKFYRFINQYPHLSYELFNNKIKITSSIDKEFIFHLSLLKINLNTADAVRILRSYFKSDINFSGNKDRRAITIQKISIKITLKKLIDYFLYFEKTQSPNILIGQIFLNRSHLKLGDHTSNYFKIIVRDDAIFKNRSYFKNFFGEQRFGKNKNNHIVGEYLFKKRTGEAKEILRKNGIEKLSRKDRIFYIHAYQSSIFNEQLKKDDFKNLYCINKKIQIKENERDHSKKCYALELHNTNSKKIYLRKIYAEPINFLHKKLKIGHQFKFTLEPSVYATVFIEELFKIIK